MFFFLFLSSVHAFDWFVVDPCLAVHHITAHAVVGFLQVFTHSMEKKHRKIDRETSQALNQIKSAPPKNKNLLPKRREELDAQEHPRLSARTNAAIAVTASLYSSALTHIPLVFFFCSFLRNGLTSSPQASRQCPTLISTLHL